MSEKPKKKSVYRPALTPGLRRLLAVIAIALALLGANSVYLATITFLGFVRDANYENQFYLYMFLTHLAVGFLLIVPFLVFGALHMRNTWKRRNKRAVRIGYWLFGVSVGVIVTGIVMTVRVLPLDSIGGRVTYWLHVLLPVAAIFLYVAHRLFGPRIRWRWGVAYGVSILAFAGLMALMHGQDPRLWNVRGGGEAYFHPSEARTATTGFIPERALMMNDYCQECHPDAVRQHEQSVHHFSSFNNPLYLFSVRETRKVMMERDGNMQGARFCAGCHDPVPFFSGAFDDPDYDDVNDPTSQVGITCTVCHAITAVEGTIGNANYTIEEPLQYPFAYSDNPVLSFINRRLVEAKPAFHKKTFLKPLHEDGAFCAVCHKVNLPYELNHYKEWLRGQNHWDSFLLSGVSGGAARSFYYPEVAKPDCQSCHMPEFASDDPAAAGGYIHDHRFPGANTAIPHLVGDAATAAYQQAFLEDGQVDVDVFALRKGAQIDGELLAPLRPELPALVPGESYLLDVVIRTLKVGHIFTQGTADSNELWLDVTVKIGDRVIGRSGAMDEEGGVDPWSHFVNAYVLDRHGNRIDRRNAQDIFVPLYSNQQPPGTGQVVHYRLDVPADAAGKVEIDVALKYRKFDKIYMDYVYDDLRARGEWEGPNPELPIAVMSSDRLELPIAGSDGVALSSPEPRKPLWQRWRDYGIGLFRKGAEGATKGELRQAAVAFRRVIDLERPEGWVDLARVHEKEGRVEEARLALTRAVEEGVRETWTVNWLSGLIDKQNGYLDQAIASFEKVIETRIPERGFDFSKDYEIILELGQTLLQRAQIEQGEARRPWLEKAVARLDAVLALDAENLGAHYNLMLCYRLLGDREREDHHRRLVERYRPDDNAADRAVAIHRAANPAADHAANATVIHDLSRSLPEPAEGR